jgi:hypothetical protein
LITKQEFFQTKGATKVIFISGEITISGEEFIAQNGRKTN